MVFGAWVFPGTNVCIFDSQRDVDPWAVVLVDRCLSVCEEIKYQKGIWWMPWCQEAMKDVTRCEKPWGAASEL